MKNALKSVYRRKRIQEILNGAAWGLFAGIFSLWLIPAGVIFGAVLSLMKRIDPLDSARLADAHHQLQDRLVTAAELSLKQTRSVIESLQLADAEKYLQCVKPDRVKPLRFPRIFFPALAAILLAQGVRHIPFTAVEIPQPLELPVQELALILPDDIKPLAEKLNTLKKNPKEQLATLSEIQESVLKEQKSLELGKLLDSMRDLADAFNASKVLQPLGKKLQKENYAEVAEALKKFDAEKLQQMSNTESKNAGKELQQAAEKMKERQHEALQKAAEQLAKGIKDKNSAEMKEAVEQLANEIQKQDTRQQVSQQLAASLAKLAEAKANALQGTENGGKQTEISKQSTKNWGMGDAQNPTGGEKTQLAGQRQQQSVKGQIGSQGNSEKEKGGGKETEKPENAESRLDYKNVFPQYQKTAEAVLDTEPVPLGKRLMIRQYFENIRPD